MSGHGNRGPFEKEDPTTDKNLNNNRGKGTPFAGMLPKKSIAPVEQVAIPKQK